MDHFAASDSGHIHINAWHRQHERQYQHDTFLQPQKSKGGRTFPNTAGPSAQGHW